MPNFTCPECSHVIVCEVVSRCSKGNVIVLASAEQRPPENGDVTICGGCMTLFTIDGDSLKAGTYMDVMQVPKAIRELHELMTGKRIRVAGDCSNN